jgi:hypothetical protein
MSYEDAFPSDPSSPGAVQLKRTLDESTAKAWRSSITPGGVKSDVVVSSPHPFSRKRIGAEISRRYTRPACFIQSPPVVFTR